MASQDIANSAEENGFLNRRWCLLLLVFLFSGAIYLGCVISPPSLMDDVDAVQAMIAKGMLSSGDWVTARLDGVLYLEKSPLIYWLIAICYKVFGISDWVARLPVALSSVGLAVLSACMGMWAFGKRAGFYAGLIMATCVGLFLFTRIQIPDVMLTFTITLAMWAFLRALDGQEKRPGIWAGILAASLGTGLLLKSLVAIVFPVAAALIYLLVTRQLFSRRTWQRLRPISGTLIAMLIAVPWHVLATLRNPPYFAWTLKSGPGLYHGFLWFYFINEQLLRFLNLRYPRDYNTVPRLYFWLFHLLWLFPWSVYLPSLAKLSFKPVSRRANQVIGAVLDRLHPRIFYVFYDAGILLNALLPGAGAVTRLSNGCGWNVGKTKQPGSRNNCGNRGVSVFRNSILCAQFSDAGRYSFSTLAAPVSVHIVPGTHAGPYVRFVCLSSLATVGGGRSLSAGSRRQSEMVRGARLLTLRNHDGVVLSRGQAGTGGV